NYTVSRNSSNASSDRDSDAFNGPSDPFNFLALDFGRSQLDIRNQFSAYGYFLLPADIEFSTIIAARSGRAFPVWSSLCSDTPANNPNLTADVVAPFGFAGVTGLGFLFQDCFQSSNNFNPVRPVVGGELLGRYPQRN
ncbi:hypothetical protein MYX77_13165, partial [Acidobacteriia bacterium AH_259_A11_L15]|nr:hypothetical protein [Acidobacteriia bacterium AH_259_A11_L15]